MFIESNVPPYHEIGTAKPDSTPPAYMIKVQVMFVNRTYTALLPSHSVSPETHLQTVDMAMAWVARGEAFRLENIVAGKVISDGLGSKLVVVRYSDGAAGHPGQWTMWKRVERAHKGKSSSGGNHAREEVGVKVRNLEC